ncbi:hypothetical protein JKP88DRAFT_247979 [Tribonema minus]|uniref:Uncharacterized protein n=1 Tax=Tribonema minus TaxID=303371 RepID=A0A835YNW3_9STRA|nr:hypothetical protein JKP88DRAFT_247979 [Tribonema minus]
MSVMGHNTLTNTAAAVQCRDYSVVAGVQSWEYRVRAAVYTREYNAAAESPRVQAGPRFVQFNSSSGANAANKQMWADWLISVIIRALMMSGRAAVHVDAMIDMVYVFWQHIAQVPLWACGLLIGLTLMLTWPAWRSGATPARVQPVMDQKVQASQPAREVGTESSVLSLWNFINRKGRTAKHYKKGTAALRSRQHGPSPTKRYASFLHSSSVCSGVSVSGIKWRDVLWLGCLVLCVTSVAAEDMDVDASGGGSAAIEIACAAVGKYDIVGSGHNTTLAVPNYNANLSSAVTKEAEVQQLRTGNRFSMEDGVSDSEDDPDSDDDSGTAPVAKKRTKSGGIVDEASVYMQM